MKRKYLYAMITILMLIFVFQVEAQENFQVKWSMDNNLTGLSSHANFSPDPAKLLGGGNAYAINNGYGLGGAIVAAYVVRPWPTFFSSGRYMEFSFAANSFKYNVSSISFRLRRSLEGPPQIKVRSSMNNFSADLSTHNLATENLFYSYSIPTSFNDLSNNTFSIRIYAYSSLTIQGTLWFDEIIINGQVLAIVLPIDLTYFKAEKSEENVMLSWETAWEKNSREFIVERSSDLKKFHTIGTLKAAGEAPGRMQYDFIDGNPLPGANYYRLRMVDRDDTYTFSKTLDVTTNAQENPIMVIPNPVAPEKITISGQNIDPHLLLLTNQSGSAISLHFEPIPGNLIHLYPEQPLISGLYFLTYLKNGRKEHVKILVP